MSSNEEDEIEETEEKRESKDEESKTTIPPSSPPPPKHSEHALLSTPEVCTKEKLDFKDVLSRTLLASKARLSAIDLKGDAHDSLDELMSPNVEYRGVRIKSHISLDLEPDMYPMASYLSSAESHDIAMESIRIIVLNIGGRRFQVRLNTLRSIPNSRLYDLALKLGDEPEDKHRELFFDRNPDVFCNVLDLYRTKSLHVPFSQCIATFRQELEFWKISESRISLCCRKKYMDFWDEKELDQSLLEQFRHAEAPLPRPWESQSPSLFKRVRQWIWYYLERPRDGGLAVQLLDGIYYAFVLASIGVCFVGTMESCRLDFSHRDHHPFGSGLGNLFTVDRNSSKLLLEREKPYLLKSPKMALYASSYPHAVLFLLDFSCLAFFLLEFLLRLFSCPALCEYLTRVNTWCDITYLIPALALHLGYLVDPLFWHQAHTVDYYIYLEAAAMLRVIRIMELAKNSRVLRMVKMSLRASTWELIQLLLIAIIAIILFGVLLYLSEITLHSDVTTLAQGMYCAVITMTTVGYGDVVPCGWLGQVMASLCCVSGMLILGMPIPIITSNFHLYYNYKIPETSRDQSEGGSRKAIERELVSPASVRPSGV